MLREEIPRLSDKLRYENKRMRLIASRLTNETPPLTRSFKTFEDMLGIFPASTTFTDLVSSIESSRNGEEVLKSLEDL